MDAQTRPRAKGAIANCMNLREAIGAQPTNRAPYSRLRFTRYSGGSLNLLLRTNGGSYNALTHIGKGSVREKALSLIRNIKNNLPIHASA